MRCCFSTIIALFGLTIFTSLAEGQVQTSRRRDTPHLPVNSNNILVAIKHSLREFTPAGTLVQTIPFNYGGRAYSGNPPTEQLQDIVVDQYGWIDSYNGCSNPFLTRYDSNANSFIHQTFPGWSSYSGNGGIAAYQNFVFATDMSNNFAFANGIVRFNLFDHTAARFANGIDFIDLNVGLDGKLYALTNSSADIYVYDPATMQLLNHITKPSNVTWMGSLAVDQTGHIFVTGRDGTISRLNSAGVLEMTKATGFQGLTDIDVDETGRLIVGQWEGRVLIGDTSLGNDFSSFFAGDSMSAAQTIFVSFAHAVPPPAGPVPTPIPTPAATPSPAHTHDVLVSLGNVVAGIGNSQENSVREFTPDGSLLRQIKFNYNNGSYPSAECLRDIVVDPNGTINAFNGTFAPLLTRFTWDCSTFTHSSFAAWSMVNTPTNGGIAAYQNFIYATDMKTGSDTSQATGIVRFDTSNNTAVRFVNGTEFLGLNVGLDGKLYALAQSTSDPNSGGIRVYDPITMQLLQHLNFPTGVSSHGKIAVAQNGKIFIIDWYGTVYRLSSSGQLEASTATGFPHLTDIDIDETGRLIMGQDEGWVVIGDTTLNNFSSFRAINDGNEWMINVALAPLAPAPPVGLLDVVSEKTHDSAGTFDIDLPFDGPRGVECRDGGPNHDYTMIFTFAHQLLKVGDVCCRGATVSTSTIDQHDPHRYIVNLTGATNATYIFVTLDDVDGSEGTHNDTVYQEMGLLVGDVNGDGFVNAGDTIQAKSQSSNTVITSNFRVDVNTDGFINVGDTALVKSKSGTALP